MLRRKIHIGQGFLDSVLHLFGSFGKLHRPEFFRYLERFFTSSILALLCMDRLEHKRYRFHLVTGRNRKYISVKMNCTTLISGIRKDFWNSFKHAEVLVANDQSNTSKPAFLQPYEEKERQLSRSSFIPSAAPRISRQPSWLTPMATRTETFWISPPQLRFR